MNYAFIDFETRSEIDLKLVGAECYARHPSTRPLIMCYAINNGPIKTTTDFEDLPIAFSCVFVAHNAQFERAILRHCLPHWAMPEHWIDTAAMSRRAGLPGSLDGAAEALGLVAQKDKRGKASINLFSKLQKPTKKSGQAAPYFIDPQDRPSEFAEFCAYCARDVEAERELFYAIGPEIMTPAETAAMNRNWWSNETGIAVDVAAIDGAIRIIDSEEKRAGEMLTGITDGFVTTPNQVGKIALYCGLESVSAPAILESLKDPEIDADAAAVLRIRADVGRTSVKKLRSLKARINGGRTRDLTIYHGAHTGRETGTGPQPLNMPKGKFAGRLADLESALGLITAADAPALRARFGSPLGAISSAMRGMFIPSPGMEFHCADMASIEARLVFWFAGESGALQCYREGVDQYKLLAATIYNTTVDKVTKEQREIGKRGILGLGFGMGADRFVGMVKEQSGLVIERELAETAKQVYRSKYSKVPRLWYLVESAARNALATGGPCRVAGLSYRKDRKWLVCTLPSGRELRYYDPQLDEDLQLTHMGMVGKAGGARKWARDHTYGGKLVENAVQATARDLLQVFCERIEALGYSIVLTVYDEILAEKEIGAGDLNDLISIMSTPPKWCADLPLGADGWTGGRYRK